MIASLFFIAKLIEVEGVLVSYKFDLIFATKDRLMMKRVQFINRPRFPVVSLIYFNDLVNLVEFFPMRDFDNIPHFDCVSFFISSNNVTHCRCPLRQELSSHIFPPCSMWFPD